MSVVLSSRTAQALKDKLAADTSRSVFTPGVFQQRPIQPNWTLAWRKDSDGIYQKAVYLSPETPMLVYSRFLGSEVPESSQPEDGADMRLPGLLTISSVSIRDPEVDPWTPENTGYLTRVIPGSAWWKIPEPDEGEVPEDLIGLVIAAHHSWYDLDTGKVFSGVVALEQPKITPFYINQRTTGLNFGYAIGRFLPDGRVHQYRSGAISNESFSDGVSISKSDPIVQLVSDEFITVKPDETRYHLRGFHEGIDESTSEEERQPDPENDLLPFKDVDRVIPGREPMPDTEPGVLAWSSISGFLKPSEPQDPEIIPFEGYSETSETALEDSWEAGETGLDIWNLTRVVYKPEGDKKLYGFYRKYTYTKNGQLFSVSDETRVELHTTVAMNVACTNFVEPT